MEEKENEICEACEGSGKGLRKEVICSVCRGSGEMHSLKEEFTDLWEDSHKKEL